MALFKRDKTAAEAAPPAGAAEPAGAAAPSGAGSDDLALDATAMILRVWGQNPLRVDEREPEVLAELFEGWARHVLTASAAPGRKVDESGRRDWPALGRFVTDHRTSECAAVARSVADLGEVIWLFVQSLGRAIDDGRSSDETISARIAQLRDAVDSGDPEKLKREAMQSVSLIQEQLELRREREQSEVEALASRLSEVTDELVGVRQQLGTDALTGIANRAALDDHLDRVISLGKVLRQSAILFMIDVDHFKWVNDKYGHTAGDQLLSQMGSTLAGVFRRRGDFVARYGGDEFAAVILDDSLEVAERIAERLLYAVRDFELEWEGEDAPIRVSVSIGGARLKPGASRESWVEQADRALYQAKELGRDRFALATGDRRIAHDHQPKT